MDGIYYINRTTYKKVEYFCFVYKFVLFSSKISEKILTFLGTVKIKYYFNSITKYNYKNQSKNSS